MILACHKINKSFGDHVIIRDGSFHIEDHEKAALIGPTAPSPLRSGCYHGGTPL